MSEAYTCISKSGKDISLKIYIYDDWHPNYQNLLSKVAITTFTVYVTGPQKPTDVKCQFALTLLGNVWVHT